MADLFIPEQVYNEIIRPLEDKKDKLERSRDGWMALCYVLAFILSLVALKWWFQDCRNLFDSEGFVIGSQCFDRGINRYDLIVAGVIGVIAGGVSLARRRYVLRKENPSS